MLLCYVCRSCLFIIDATVYLLVVDLLPFVVDSLSVVRFAYVLWLLLCLLACLCGCLLLVALCLVLFGFVCFALVLIVVCCLFLDLVGYLGDFFVVVVVVCCLLS